MVQQEGTTPELETVEFFPLFGFEISAIETELQSGHPSLWFQSGKQTVYPAINRAKRKITRSYDYWEEELGEYVQVEKTAANIATIAVAANTTVTRMHERPKPVAGSLTEIHVTRSIEIAGSLLGRLTEFAGGERAVEEMLKLTYSDKDYKFPQNYPKPTIYFS